MRNYGMQREVLEKYLKNGCSANRNINKNGGYSRRFPAFSLGEMLLVLLIMSFLAISIPGIHFKKSVVKTKRTLHGRYECYYACPLTTDADGTKRHLSGCATGDYKLFQYQVNEEGAATGPEEPAGGKCLFTPPKEAIFFLVHAVGGGGGASSTNGSVMVNSVKTTSQTYTNPNTFPKWLRDVQGANALVLEGGTTSYNATISGNYAKIGYGRSGQAGKTMSMFFPRLQNVEVEMYPGLGGARGASGSKTEVYFNTSSSSGNKRTKIIEAEGGAAGSGSGTAEIWLDGPNAMCAVKENDDIGFREADFATNVELDKGSLMESKMEEVKFGSGGAGSYGNVTTTGSVTYLVNAVDVSTHVKKLRCNDPTMCGDGSNSNPCPGQAGRNGAVVILW